MGVSAVFSESEESRAFPGGVSGKELPCECRRLERGGFNPCLGLEDLLEEDKATHSSIHVQRISRTEEPRGPQSIGLQRVSHD